MKDLWFKIVDDYKKGSNIIILCEARALNSKYFQEVISHICTIESVGTINFGGLNKGTG